MAKESEMIQETAKAEKLFDAFTAKDWCELLTYRPEFADVCRWEKIQPKTCSVVDLLVAQPQFAERISIAEFCDGDSLRWIVDAHPELVYKIPQGAKFSCDGFHNYEGIAKVIDKQMIDAFAQRLDFDWRRPSNFKWLIPLKPELRALFDVSALSAMDWGDMIAANPEVESFCPKPMLRPDAEMQEWLKDVELCMREFEKHHWILSRWREYVPFADFRRNQWQDDWRGVLRCCTPEELKDLASIVPWKNFSASDWCYGLFKNWSNWCDHEWLANEIRVKLDNDDGVSMLLSLLDGCPAWVEERFSDVLNAKLAASKENVQRWLSILKRNPSCAKYMKSFKNFERKSLARWELEDLISAQPSLVDLMNTDFTPPTWSVVLRYRPDLADKYQAQDKTWGSFMAEHWVNILIGDPSLLSKFKGKLVKDGNYILNFQNAISCGISRDENSTACVYAS